MFWCISRQRSQTLFVLTFSAVLLLFAAAVTLAISSGKKEPQAVAVAAMQEWGLSFQQGSSCPVPNLSAETLAPYDAFYYHPTAVKRLYLTFDAGYENGNTAPILDALKKHRASGTFFVVGPYIKENPDLVKRMLAEGHIVGNHTDHHPNMSQKNEADFTQELISVEKLFIELTGQPMQKFYRPPEGKFSYDNLTLAQSMGYKTIFWSLAYVDWNTSDQPDGEKALRKLLSRTHDGAIVLLHVTSSTNAAILDDLLTEWEKAGYTFGSLTELGADV
ncbi:MAG: polysaccharide deacetylase family protein [Ruthenibacterium sp.]